MQRCPQRELRMLWSAARPALTRLVITLAIAASASASAGCAWAAGKAHEHDALKPDAAIDGNKRTIAMEAPLDNLLGFERARTDAQRKAAADVLARLRSPVKGHAAVCLGRCGPVHGGQGRGAGTGA